MALACLQHMVRVARASELERATWDKEVPPNVISFNSAISACEKGKQVPAPRCHLNME